jgi:hypothetical protein
MIRRFPRQATTKSFRSDKIHPVPVQFRQKHPFPYPPSNTHEFERWFHDTLTPEEIIGDRIYLPVFWTAYWLKSGYGQKLRERQALQAFINSLDRSKKFFTICQYDDGPMIDFKDLDIIVFGMGGGRIDYPIPLLCQPHGFKFDCKRDIFASFVGSDTHQIRRQLVAEFAGKKDCLVTMKKYPPKEYCNILARSVFALCPRGYGASSFRIMEAIHYGAIPIYIGMNGDWVLPYWENFNTYGQLVQSVDIHKLPNYISGAVKSTFYINELREGIEKIKHLFTYEGCKKKILENI